jgi:hypothetical protein
MDLFCDDDSDGSNDSSNEDEMKRDLNPSYRQMMLSKRPQNCGVMAFHSGTEESLFLYVQRNAQQGDPLSVLKAIDVFCYSRHWMMHTGDRKVKFLDKALQTSKKLKHGTSIAVKINDCSIIDNRIKSTDGSISDGTKIRTTDGLICLEIGSYCGYSAVKIAATFEENVGSFLYCIGNFMYANDSINDALKQMRTCKCVFKCLSVSVCEYLSIHIYDTYIIYKYRYSFIKICINFYMFISV